MIDNQENTLIACDDFCPSVKDPFACISCGAKYLDHIPRNEDGQVTFKIKQNPVIRNTFPIGLPTTGLVRFEWAATMMQMSYPMCMNTRTIRRPIDLNIISPIGYHVAEARNLIVQDFLKTDSEWLFFIDHDVLLPPNTYYCLLEHIRAKKYPIISGLYCVKTPEYQPIVLRGRGDGAYTDFKLGDQVECDGIPMGCALIHRSILQLAWSSAREVRTTGGEIVREVFRSPRDWIIDPETNLGGMLIGTEDLWFCERVMENKLYERLGWTTPSKEYPFLVDTRIRCNHIGSDGRCWPLAWPIPMQDPMVPKV
jgi:hypothetical protein